MRLAVEFKRIGAARYVSHLDMQRTVMRAVRRTKLEPEYSQGFNPHMQLSFASAMPVGLESESEYFELRLLKETPLDFCLSELKRTMPEGITPVWAGKLSDTAPKLMAALRYAAYEVSINENQYKTVKIQIENLLQLGKIEVEIERKETAVKKDIRPLIYSVKANDAPNLHMILALSSDGSLNPEVLLKAAAEAAEIKFEYLVRRIGLFTMKDNILMPLRNLCD